MQANRLSAIAAIVLGGFAGSPVSAAVINFTASGGSDTFELAPSAQDATVTFDVRTASVDLTPGMAETVTLNEGRFSTPLLVGASGTANGSGLISQTLTVSSGTATPTPDTAKQGVTVFTDGGNGFTTPPSAIVYVFGDDGDPFEEPSRTFDLGSIGILTITPLGGTSGQVFSTPGTFTNSATFLLTTVPEPASGLLVAAAGSLLMARRRGR